MPVSFRRTALREIPQASRAGRSRGYQHLGVNVDTTQSVVERSAIRKVAIRLVPFVALMFFINYLDRTAISFAGPNGMNTDLALSAAQFGFASGVFFIGYILLEVPSNLALHKFGARRWMARIMVTWGILSACTMLVSSALSFFLLRFLLGIAAPISGAVMTAVGGVWGLTDLQWRFPIEALPAVLVGSFGLVYLDDGPE